jgi:hypothetical protein
VNEKITIKMVKSEHNQKKCAACATMHKPDKT